MTVNALPVYSTTAPTSVCVGDAITLSATPAGGVWSIFSGSSSSSLSGSTLTGSGAGTTVVRYTDGNGCVVDQSITVNGLPPVSAGVDQSICSGESVTLTASGASSLSWDNGIGATNPATVSPTSTTTYEVTGTDGNGCVNTDQVIVTVNDVPSISGATEVCADATITLSADITGGTWDSDDDGVATVSAGGVVTGVSSGTVDITYTMSTGCKDTYSVTVYAKPVISGTLSGIAGGSTVSLSATGTAAANNPWTSSNTAIASVSATGVVTPVSVGTADITFTNSNGCSATATFTVSAAPSITSTTTDICAGGSINLTATPTGGTWSVPSSAVGSINASTGVFTGSSSGSVVVTYSKGGASATTTVTVNALPVYSTTAPTSVCVGDAITLSATPAGGVWSIFSGSSSSSLSGSTLTGSGAGTTVVRYTDGNGCVVDQSITVNGLPPVSAGVDQSICSGESVTLTASGASSLSWDNGIGATNPATVSPTSTTTYEVTGTDGNGCVNTDQVIVTVNDVPSISGATEVCADATITLSADITGGTWDSDDDGVATVSAGGVVTGVSSGTVDITYTMSTGCKDTYSVTVYAKPVISGTLSGIAGGSTVSLSATGTAAANNPWTSSNTAIASVSATGVVTPVSVGTADITFTNSNGCSATATFTVSAAPSITSTTTDICAGGSINLTATPTGGTWSVPSSAVGSINASTGVFTGSSSGSVVVTYSKGGASATTTVTVNALPVYSTTAPTSVCVGDAITLSATPAGGVWSIFSGSSSSSLSGSTLTGSGAGTTVVRYTDGNGCVVDQSITVNGLPPVSAGVDQSICSGESVTLTASGASSLSWDNGIGATNPATVSPTSTTTYEVTGTDGNGCVNTDQVIVTVNDVPSISGATEVCADATITLSADITGGTWDSDDDGVATVSAGGVVTGVSSGTVDITYTMSTGCKDTYSVTVYAKPVISGTLSGIAGGSTVSLSATGTAAANNPWTSSNTAIASVSATGVVTPVSVGTADITFTNSNGCSATATFTVSAAPSITSTTTDICAGGSINLTATPTGGTWSVPSSAVGSINASTGVFTGSSSGSVVVTYSKGGASATTTVTVNALPVYSTTAPTSVCVGDAITLSATPAGGVWSIFSGSSSSSLSGSTLTGSGAGTTVVRYTDGNGCVVDQSITVNGLPPVSAGVDQSICSGESVTLTASGASSLSWDNGIGATNPATVSPTSTTTYEVTGTDGNGCVNTDQVIVTVNDVPSISGATEVCADATITLSADITGGTWDSDDDGVATVSAGGVVTGVSSGTVDITYTMSTGCKDTYSVTVYAKPVISGTLSGIAGGSTVSLSATGTAAANNPWTSSNTAIASVSATGVVTPVSVGTADITFTNSNGCSATATFTVSAAPSITSTTTDICAGGSINLTATPTGGTWSVPSSAVGSINASTGVFTGSSSGSVVVTYSKGGASATTTVTVNALPVYSTTAPTSVCVGDAITLSATPAGGVWSIFSGSSSSSLSGSTLTGSGAGTTVVRYTDGNGCVVDQSITVNGLPPVSAGVDQSICSGESVTLTASGASSLSWDNGIGATNPATVSPTSTTTYEVTGTDGNGCVNTDQVIVTVNDVPSISGATEVCADATITLSADITGGTWDSDDDGVATVSAGGVVTGVSSGTVDITYTMSTGCKDTYSVTVYAKPVISGTLSGIAGGSTVSLSATGTAAANNPWTSSNTAIASVSATGVVTPVSVGTADITFTNSNGCSATATFTVSAAPSITSTTTDICAGGSINLTATPTGGTWSVPSSAVGSINASTGVFTGSSSGSVVVTYSKGGASATTTVTVNALPVYSTTAPTSVCVGDAITLSATPAGGVWSIFSGSSSSSLSGSTLTGSGAGTTVVRYTDGNGCVVDQSITVNGLPPVSAGVDQSICSGESVTLTASGASSLSWDNGIGATNPATVSPTSTTTYEVTGTDGNGCVNTDQVIVTVNDVPSISGATEVCADATITLSADITGGTWDSDDDGVATVSAGGVVTGVSSGTVDITYTMSTGCKDTYSVTVYAKPVISGTLSGIAGGSTVSLSATGTAAANNPWTSSNTAIASVSATGVVTPVSVGTADITFTNSNGCSATATFTVSAAPSITSTTTDICAGGSINLTATPTGGTWSVPSSAVGSINASTGVFTGSSSGSVVVTYSKGGASATTTVTVNALPVYSTTAPTSVCVGDAITLSATPAGGVWSIFSGSSSSSLSGSTLTGSGAGTTVVRYTDGNGCVVDQSITVNGLPPVSAGVDQSICSGESVTLTASGASSLSWDNGIGATNPATVSPTSTTTYEVTGTDGNGCVNTDQVIVTVNDVPSISGATEVCADATITLSADITGGTWDSDDDGVATVSAGGVVTGVSSGTVDITYTMSTGCKDTYSVTVYAKPVISGTLSGIAGGSTVSLSATGTAAANNPWTSSNTAIASVSATGVVTPVSVGTADITFTNSNGCSATATFTVSAGSIDYFDSYDGHLCWRVNQLDGDANGRYLECSFFSGRFYQCFYGRLYGF